VADAWRTIMQFQHEPCCLILSRQNMPTFDRTKYSPAAVAKGGYVLADSQGKPEVILMASGSEVSLCVDAYEKLKAEGVKARVVSMPSWELYEKQPQAYRDSVMPPDVKARVAVEQASTFGWSCYVGISNPIVGMKTFGASAPLKELQKKFGFTTDHVIEAAKHAITANR
jgi:transketolase